MNYSEKNVDFTKILNESHEGKWVALSEDRTKVVDYDEKLRDLAERVKGIEVVYMKVPRSDIFYAFACA